jgi:hypothetical protein
MWIKKYSLLVCFWFVSLTVWSQEEETTFMNPGLSPSMLNKGQFETQFNSAYGVFYTKSYDWTNVYTNNQHQKISAIAPSIRYGLSRTVNIGMTYQFYHISQTFLLDQDGFTSRYTSQSIGPLLRIRLFRKNNILEGYFESGMLIPLNNYMPKNKFTFTNQFVTTARLSSYVMVSLQINCTIFPIFSSEKHPISMPINLFAGYLINSNFMPFLVAGHVSDFGSAGWLDDHKYYRLNYYSNAGIGLKYRLFRHTSLGAYYLFSFGARNGDHYNNAAFQISQSL